MRAINSARILADMRGEKLTVIWFVNPELGCPFEKIFEPTDKFRVINIHSKWDIRKMWYQLTSMAIGSFIGNDEIRKNRADGTLNEAYAGSLKKHTYIATEEHFYPCHDYSAFVPSKEVMERIETKKQELGEYAVGVHIRRTDNKPAIGKSSTDCFIESMQKEVDVNLNTMFYLATDDMSEEKRLREIFPDKIISNENRDLSRDSIAGIQDAMLDLYCLAATKKIIGSFFSSFTDIAADMHQVPKIIAGE
ncbi:MAG: hypothetical protein IJZ44_07250 [Lachnospiraceae bacterium]|nr:hypothetical protein [Lachnospiraceae bacterium]